MNNLAENIKYGIATAHYYLVVLVAVVWRYFVRPVLSATAISVNATLSLPHNIATAIEEAKATRQLEAEMDAALIDHGFLNRAMLGLTPADEQKIAEFMKGEK